jgi:EF hand domain-containing protein
MRMNKLAFATLVAMGMTAAAIAQQPGQSPSQRSTQPSTQPRSTQPTQPRTPQPSPAPRGGDRTEQVTFEHADKNADGQVSRQEANEIDGFDFSRADTNNDATLSRQEYQAAMATSTPREGPIGRNEAGGSARSGDTAPGSRSPESASRSGEAPGSRSSEAPGQQRSAQVSFDTADKDKDGKVTRQEASDVPGLDFTSADTNADASLSRQEFQVALAGAQPRL